jgi:DNA-binding NtrC family response regulator
LGGIAADVNVLAPACLHHIIASMPPQFLNRALTIEEQPNSVGLGMKERTAEKGIEMRQLEPNAAAAESLVGLPVAEVEKSLILATLRLTDGNRTRAAHLLGISIRTMRNKIREYAEDGEIIPASLSHHE